LRGTVAGAYQGHCQVYQSLTKVTVKAIGSLGVARRRDERRCPARAWPSGAPSPPSRAVPWSSFLPQARFWRQGGGHPVARDHRASATSHLGHGDRRSDHCSLSDGPAGVDGDYSHALYRGCGPSPPSCCPDVSPPRDCPERRCHRLCVVRWTSRTDRLMHHHECRCNSPCLGGTWCQNNSRSWLLRTTTTR
jgi:hypothetical protein